MKQLQENNELKWKIARSSLCNEIKLKTVCHFCKKVFYSYETKVFHNVKGPRFVNYRGNKKNIITHINICFTCRHQIPRGWFPCRCKKGRKLCQQMNGQ